LSKINTLKNVKNVAKIKNVKKRFFTYIQENIRNRRDATNAADANGENAKT